MYVTLEWVLGVLDTSNQFLPAAGRVMVSGRDTYMDSELQRSNERREKVSQTLFECGGRILPWTA
jgi:hypothetical protein